MVQLLFKLSMRVLVTGAAGFIGYHLCEQLIKNGHLVVGLDNIDDYYDVQLKYDRLSNLGIDSSDINENECCVSRIHGSTFRFYKTDVSDRTKLPAIFEAEEFDLICHLAAQAGVRYSLTDPFKYAESNIYGFLNILECCRTFNVDKLLYASSSSVYGMNHKVPYSVEDCVDNPVSFYAASKKSNELMAHAYSHLFNIKTVGLRFFTVYGPWGRPDMAMFIFADSILNNKPIDIFNNGELSRDFTYIEDIINGVTSIVENFDLKGKSDRNYRIYNIGNNKPAKLIEFIEIIEKVAEKEAIKNYLPMQPGDVFQTWANVDELIEEYNYAPRTSLETGIRNFFHWYKSYYK